MPQSVFKPYDIYYIVIVFFVFSLLSPIMRAFSSSVAGFNIMPEEELFFLAFFLCICRASTIYLFLSSLTWISHRFNIPEAVLCGFYIIFPFISQVLDYEDINSQRETSMRETGSSFEVFEFHPPALFKKAYSEEGKKYISNDAIGLMQRQMASKLAYYLFYAITIALFLILLISFVVVKYREVLKTLGYNIKCFDEFKGKNNEDRFFKNIIVKIVLIALFLVEVGLYITYMAISSNSTSKLALVAPGSWVFGKSLFIPTLNHAEEMEQLEYYRRNYDLPDGREWIDERPNPVYPLVHAPKAVADAYNKKVATPDIVTTPTSSGAPNIVIALVESLSPSPYYMNNDFIENKDIVYHGKMFDDNYVPNLNKLLEKGVGFSGLSSESFPTYGGWIGFVGGNYEQDFGISLVLDEYNDLDDIPSFFRDNGYTSTYVSTSPLEFDLKNEYCFRGYEQLRGPSFLGKLPKWFDQIHYYYPKNNEAFVDLGFELDELPPLNRWSCDRLTAHQMVYHSKEYFAKREDDRPLFSLWTTVDTHGPFEGYDGKKFYESYTFGKGLSGGYNRQERDDRYSTLLKYADNYVGEVMEYFEKEQPNTIFVVVGDHGARDVNTVTSHNAITKCKGEFSPDCEKANYLVDTPCKMSNTGNDAAMTTTAVISYFGDDENVKKIFNGHFGDVYTLPTDHQDLVYTLQQYVSQFTEKPFVSARQGRDLLKLLDTTSVDELSHHISVRATGYSIEYATEKSLIRTHSLSRQHAFKVENAIYPSCLAVKGGIYSELSQNEFEQVKNLSAFLQKVDLENRLFNYQFRDLSCVKLGNCQFPKENAHYNSPTVIIWYIAVPAGILAALIIVAIILVVQSRKNNEKYDYALYKFGWKRFEKSVQPVDESVDAPTANLANTEVQVGCTVEDE